MEVYALFAYHPADGSGPPVLKSLHKTVAGAKRSVDDWAKNVGWTYYERTKTWTNGFFSVCETPYRVEM